MNSGLSCSESVLVLLYNAAFLSAQNHHMLGWGPRPLLRVGQRALDRSRHRSKEQMFI